MSAPSAEVRAGSQVDALLRRRAEGAEVLELLRVTARDPKNLNYTPYLVTALRDSGFWPLLERADAEQSA